MKNRRIMALAFAGIMTFSMFGCSKGLDNDKNQNDTKVVTSVQTEDATKKSDTKKTDEKKSDEKKSDEKNSSKNSEKKSSEEKNSNVVFTTCKSLEELNKAVGCNIMKPGVMGVTDEAYTVINGTVAQYKFTVAGWNLIIRAAKTTGDLSGVYQKDGTIGQRFIREKGEGSSGVIKSGDTYYGVWYDGDMQYAIMCLDADGQDFETFKGIYNELSAMY